MIYRGIKSKKKDIYERKLLNLEPIKKSIGYNKSEQEDSLIYWPKTFISCRQME